MRPAIYDIEVTQGDDYSLTVTFTDDADDPIDVSNQTFAGQVRTVPESATAYSFTVNSTDASTGIIVFTIARTIVVTMPEDCVYDLQMTDSERWTFMKGTFQVPREVTR